MVAAIRQTPHNCLLFRIPWDSDVLDCSVNSSEPKFAVSDLVCNGICRLVMCTFRYMTNYFYVTFCCVAVSGWWIWSCFGQGLRHLVHVSWWLDALLPRLFQEVDAGDWLQPLRQTALWKSVWDEATLSELILGSPMKMYLCDHTFVSTAASEKVTKVLKRSRLTLLNSCGL